MGLDVVTSSGPNNAQKEFNIYKYFILIIYMDCISLKIR